MSQPALTDVEREQIVAVLKELDPAAPPEKRRAARRKVLMELPIRHLLRSGKGAKEVVILANVSSRGVAILRDEPLSIGDRFTALLEFSEGGASLALYTVRNVRQLSSGLYKTGAQLLEIIEDADHKTRIPGDWVG